jgi:methylthioribose-1-phosphate isomerase
LAWPRRWASRSECSRSKAAGTKQFATEFQKLCDLMAATRPTAVNLFWAIERMKRTFAESAQGGSRLTKSSSASKRARQIHDADVASCRAMGRSEPRWFPSARDSHALQCRRPRDGRLRYQRSA